MVTQRSRGLDLVKWIALIAMVIDHLRLLRPELAVTFIPGRISFLSLSGQRGEHRKRYTRGLATLSKGRYITCMVFFSLISEVAMSADGPRHPNAIRKFVPSSRGASFSAAFPKVPIRYKQMLLKSSKVALANPAYHGSCHIETGKSSISLLRNLLGLVRVALRRRRLT